ncbi:hypothetical protein GC096_32825 [Paenibacillus sp. LMG 31461]|uniref:PH domain-containing protein n=1 Tax=Paenibacillus plantarum TaxID=2654975 RepID=A0ABX1XJZ0_9BACL|nr:STM3941 family protein [Paenibacillus plantarum]NOU68808.1 hypothetical protein [Paenibacillus plantarum]
MSDLKVPHKITGVILNLMLSIFCSLLGLVLLIKVSNNNWVILIMVFFLFSLSLIGPIQILNRIRGVPVLILTDYGLTNGRGMLFFKWDEIESFTFENIKLSEYLTVKVQNVETIINRSKGLKKYLYILFKYNDRSRNFTIINVNMLGISKSKLTEEINERLQRFNDTEC